MPRLSAIALSPIESEDTRARAVGLLGTLGAREGVPALVAALDDVRLRPLAASALGACGDRRAIRPLARAFAEERYVPARAAEASALLSLGDRAVERGVRRFLGMETGLPGGLGLLLDLGAIHGVRGDAGDLRGATLDGFACSSVGCAPAFADARLPVSARRAASRLVVRVAVEEPAIVTVSGVSSAPLDPGVRELSFDCTAIACDRPTIAVRGSARVVAYVLVPSVPEIPAPPPEPWDAGVPDASESATAPLR